MTEAGEREQVEPVIPPVAKHGHAQEKSFAAATADASGMTKQAINRHLARAEALGDDLDKVTGTSTLSRDSCFASTEAPARGAFLLSGAGSRLCRSDRFDPARPRKVSDAKNCADRF